MSTRKLIISLLAALLFVFMVPPTATGNNFDCMSFKVEDERDNSWSTYPGKEMRYIMTWSVFDPNNCIISPVRNLYSGAVMWVGLSSSQRGYWPGTWGITRSGQNAIISLEFEVPIAWLNAIGNLPGNYSFGMPTDAFSGWSKLVAYGTFDIRADNFFKKESKSVTSSIAGSEIWSTWFSKQQGLKDDSCEPAAAQMTYDFVVPRSLSYQIVESGKQAIVDITIKEDSKCALFVYTPKLSRVISTSPFEKDYLAQDPFWSKGGSRYFGELANSPTPKVRVIGNPEVVNTAKRIFHDGSRIYDITGEGVELSSSESVKRVGSDIVIRTIIDMSSYSLNEIKPSEEIGILVGMYSQYLSKSGGSSGRWVITWNSSSSWSANYSRGTASYGGRKAWYQPEFVKIPTIDLATSPQQKAAADAKNEADRAKAAADMEKANAAYKAIADAEIAKFQAELKAKQDAEVKAAAELEARQEAERKEQQKSAAAKKTTITCIKGKLTKKVTQINPKCPAGYKVKK